MPDVPRNAFKRYYDIVQSVMIPKDKFSIKEAENKLKEMGYENFGYDDKKSYYRFRKKIY